MWQWPWGSIYFITFFRALLILVHISLNFTTVIWNLYELCYLYDGKAFSYLLNFQNSHEWIRIWSHLLRMHIRSCGLVHKRSLNSYKLLFVMTNWNFDRLNVLHASVYTYFTVKQIPRIEAVALELITLHTD